MTNEHLTTELCMAELRTCQNDEDFQECKTQYYVDSLINTCSCLPFAMPQQVEINTLFRAILLSALQSNTNGLLLQLIIGAM